jgi:hypothetical protein
MNGRVSAGQEEEVRSPLRYRKGQLARGAGCAFLTFQMAGFGQSRHNSVGALIGYGLPGFVLRSFRTEAAAETLRGHSQNPLE